MVKHVLFCLIVCAVFQTGICLNILGIFPHPAISHFRVFQPLLRELANRGHNLTVISPFPLKENLRGYHDISLAEDTKIIKEQFNIDMFKKSIFRHYISPIVIASIADDICANLKSKPMIDFAESKMKFDLIITEVFCNDCFMGFMHKYKVPVVGLSSTMIMPYNNDLFGNPVNPSFIPVPFLPFSDKMNFWQRMENTIDYIYSFLVYKLMIETPGYEAAKQYFGEDLPSLAELQKNISLMLVNSHFTYSLPRPLVPGIIEVGGMFLGKPKKLPQKLEKQITDSKDGVIYFSMGSMLKGASLSENTRKEILQAFSKLKQLVFWKYENETLPGKPDNVLIQKWMPQYDILCHPNVIGFITHGGLLGTTEAVQCGVPMIIFPQYGDQFTNAKNLEVRGVGVTLDLEDVSEEILTNALQKILNPKYQKRAKQFSEEFKDRPQDPLETAIYWVEYVARHNGAPNIKSASIDLPLYQYLLIDVFAFLFCFFVTILLSVFFTIKYMCKIFCARKSSYKIKTK